jgi:hypothetical protein
LGAIVLNHCGTLQIEGRMQDVQVNERTMQMNFNYKGEVDRLVQSKKKEIPTTFSESVLPSLFKVLEYTPQFLVSISKIFDDDRAIIPIIEGKRSFRETLIHLLNFEALNYTTIYPAYLLNNPRVYPLHSERDLSRLKLYTSFQVNELLSVFKLERTKLLNFLKVLKFNDWNRQLIEENKTREETIYRMSRRIALHDYTHIQILKFQTNFED